MTMKIALLVLLVIATLMHDGGAKTNFRSSEIRPTDPLSLKSVYFLSHMVYLILDSIVVSIPACHAGDRGSIPRRGEYF